MRKRQVAAIVTAAFLILIVVLILIPRRNVPCCAAAPMSAIATLRTLNTAEITYSSTYHKGYSRGLNQLGSPDQGTPEQNHADLVDQVLSGKAQGGSNNSFEKNGYRFEYHTGKSNPTGEITTYTISARPLEFGRSGVQSYYTDQTGLLCATAEDRPATAKDNPL